MATISKNYTGTTTTSAGGGKSWVKTYESGKLVHSTLTSLPSTIKKNIAEHQRETASLSSKTISGSGFSGVVVESMKGVPETANILVKGQTVGTVVYPSSSSKGNLQTPYAKNLVPSELVVSGQKIKITKTGILSTPYVEPVITSTAVPAVTISGASSNVLASPFAASAKEAAAQRAENLKSTLTSAAKVSTTIQKGTVTGVLDQILGGLISQKKTTTTPSTETVTTPSITSSMILPSKIEGGTSLVDIFENIVTTPSMVDIVNPLLAKATKKVSEAGKALITPSKVNLLDSENLLTDITITTSPTGGSATAYITPKTPTEVEANVLMESTYLGANPLKTTITKRDIQSSINRLTTLSNQMSSLQLSNSNDGIWTGTASDYNRYNSLAGQYDIELQRLKSYGVTISDTGVVSYPTLSVGIGKLSKDVSIAEIPSALYENKNLLQRISTPVEISSLFTGAMSSKALSSTVKLIGAGTQAEEAFGYLGSEVGSVLPYITPIGQATFIAKTLGDVGEDLIKEGGGVVTALKENYPEIIMSGVMLGTHIAKRIKTEKADTLADPLRDYLEVIKSERILENIPSKVNPILEPSIAIKVIKRSVEGSENYTKIIDGVEKGTTKIIESYPTKDYVGDILEVVKADPFRIYAGKIYSGEAGLFKYIEFEKYTKVEKFSPTGEGVIRLFDKKGNLVYETAAKIDTNILPEITKLPTEKILTDLDLRNIYEVKEVGGNILEPERKVTARTEEGIFEVVTPEGKPAKVDLTAKKIFGETKLDVTEYSYPEKGVIAYQTDKSLFSDVMTSGERKSMVELKEVGKKVRLKTRTGQQIIYGFPEEIDLTLSKLDLGKEVVKKRISPKTGREIISAEGGTFASGYINPKYAKLFETEGIKEVDYSFKEISDRIKNINREAQLRAAKQFFDVRLEKIKDVAGEIKDSLILIKETKKTGKSKELEKAESENIIQNDNIMYVAPPQYYLKGRSKVMQRPSSQMISLTTGIPVLESSARTAGLLSTGNILTSSVIAADTLSLTSPQKLTTSPTLELSTETLQNELVNILENVSVLEQTQQVQQQQQQLQQVQQQQQTFSQLGLQTISPTFFGTPFAGVVGTPIDYEFEKKKKKSIVKSVPTYRVAIKKRGRYIPLAGEYTKARAYKIGGEKVLTDIARTARIIPTGKKKEVFGEFGMEQERVTPDARLFRTYKIRKGKQIPLKDEFIQRTSANLQSWQEKSQLKESRRIERLLGGIID